MKLFIYVTISTNTGTLGVGGVERVFLLFVDVENNVDVDNVDVCSCSLDFPLNFFKNLVFKCSLSVVLQVALNVLLLYTVS